MRIGICLNMLSRQPDGTGVEYAGLAGDVGFDYVELPLAEMSAMEDAAFAALERRLDMSGLRCECCNNLFPKTMRLTGENADEAVIENYLKESLRRAALLGVSCVVFGSGPAKTIPMGFPPEEGYRQATNIAGIAADIASGYGIGIVIEPLRREECNLINTYEEGCRLARDTERDNVHALVDYYHFSQVREPIENLTGQGGFLRHVHFARNEGRSFPSSMSEEPESYARFAQALHEIGYTGRVSLEAYSKDVESEAPPALAFMRNLFNGRG